MDKYLEFDLGTLLAVDKTIDERSLSTGTGLYLKQTTTENVQLLINEIWNLPRVEDEDAVYVKLPKAQTKLPRALPVPKPKTLTKWQAFAQAKGIVKSKKKKSKMTWDDQLDKWVPTFGYRRKQAEQDKTWLIEVPDNAKDLMEDQFAKREQEKKGRVAKNEYQRLRNVCKVNNMKIPRFGVGTNVDSASSAELKQRVTIARSSTASRGKFQPKLPKEKDAPGVKPLIQDLGRKRKLNTVLNETSTALRMADGVLKKRPLIDIPKAVSRHINDEQKHKPTMTVNKPKKGKKKRAPPKRRNTTKRNKKH